MAAKIRTGRRRYYDCFAPWYDAFIRLHAREDEGDTRRFLVDAAELDEQQPAERPLRVLDLCCGTGSVILSFADRFPTACLVGGDFSHGMLRRAQAKDHQGRVAFVETDAARLPFADDSFAAVTCSHALYELKGEVRYAALEEMKRVVHPAGRVLIMEHEVPRRLPIRLMFYLRIASMGAADGWRFLRAGLEPFRRVFPDVVLRHSPSGRSRLVVCRKKPAA